MSHSQYGLWCCDCMDFFKAQRDKEIHWIVADPPYGLGMDEALYEHADTFQGNGVALRTNYGKTQWDKKLPRAYVDEMLRISQHQFIWGGNYYADWLPPSRGWFVWDKKERGRFSNKFSDCELAWTSEDAVARLYAYTWNGMIQGNMKFKEKRVHPTQKPLPVMLRVIELYTKPEDVILDPFMGSGATLKACLSLGRRCIGIERDPRIFGETSAALAEFARAPQLDNFQSEDWGHVQDELFKE